MPPGIKGCGIVFLAFPVAHAVVQACFDRGLAAMAGTVFLGVGMALVLASVAMPWDTVRAAAGLAAGFLLWAAVGEVPHHTGHGFHVGPDHWGIVLVVGMSYALLALRRAAPRRVGAQIAFEFFLIVWALHVLLLTAYYDPRFGVHSGLTSAILVAAVLVMPWLLRTMRQVTDLSQGIRAGVVAASVLWTAVEIAMKWGWLPKPWKPMSPGAIAGCAVLLGVWSVWPHHLLEPRNSPQGRCAAPNGDRSRRRI